MPKHENYKYIATILLTMAFSTLVYRVYITKDVANLSYLWLGLMISAQIFLLLYGFDNGKIEVFIPAILVLLGGLYIFILKRRQDKQEEIIKVLKDKDIL